MTWFRLDDGWLMHPKVQSAGHYGRALWMAGGLHCAAQLTDGRIEKGVVRVLAAQADVPATAAKRLVTAGLWIDEGDHYQMHDYLDYQPSKEQVEAERERWRSSKQRRRKRGGNPEGVPQVSTVDTGVDSSENPAESPRPPVPTKGRDGCTELQRCTTAPPAAAADGNEPPSEPDPPPIGPPPDVAAAALIVAQRRHTAAQAATKANPAAWQAAAMTAIRAEVVTAAETAATLAPHLPPHTEAARPGDGHSDPNAGKPAGDTITLTAEALADLIEPVPAPPPLRPEERTQRAAQALATRDRTCPHCHGSNNWLDDNGNAHECDHHP